MSTPRQRTVIFLHIPKAAGQTLYRVLARQYKRAHTYVFQGGRQQLQLAMDQLRRWPEAKRADMQLLCGHVPYGIHTLVPNPYVYFTLLRHPVERVISQYYYVLRTPQHALYAQVTARQMSLEDYVASGINPEVDNGQTRLLAGVGLSLPFGQCPEELLQRAMENIDRDFVVAGLMERFDETLLLLKHTLGWRRWPVYTKHNVATQRQPLAHLPARTRRLIEQYNQLDGALYEFVTTRFAQAVQGLDPTELLTLQRLNKFYYPYGTLWARARAIGAWARAGRKSAQAVPG
jgi:hypothetical protein